MILSLATFAQQDPATLFQHKLYTSNYGTLPYRLLTPADAEANEKFPLILFLHGAGERGDDNDVQIAHITEIFLNADNRKKFPCYVLAPQCPKNTMWAAHERDGNGLAMKPRPSPTMAMVIGLLDKIEKELPIDRSRVYITGLSMGGYGVWELLARFPDRFAAAVPICGGGDPSTAKSFIHVPVWAFHGALDEIVRPRNSRTMIKALQDAGGKPGYTEYPGVAHDSWVYAFREPHLLTWLFSHQLEKNTGSN